MTLPYILVAPNGARRTKADHPNLPMTVDEIVATAKACFEAGANGIHAHVRDAEGRHVLDGGQYRELLRELAIIVPEMDVQITTEAVGRYSPAEQMAVVRQVQPKAVSIALGELSEHDDQAELGRFYAETLEAGTEVQHILYDPSEIRKLQLYIELGVIPAESTSLLFVLGRYTDGQVSAPEQFDAFQRSLQSSPLKERAKYMTCAFGLMEKLCLLHAASKGSDCRIGFENNILCSEGALAESNESQVAELVSALNLLHQNDGK